MTKYARKLAREGAFLMLTHGEGYSTDDGQCVPRKIAETMTGSLFKDECAIQTRHAPALKPAGDGLFPGCSQTWRNV